MHKRTQQRSQIFTTKSSRNRPHVCVVALVTQHLQTYAVAQNREARSSVHSSPAISSLVPRRIICMPYHRVYSGSFRERHSQLRETVAEMQLRPLNLQRPAALDMVEEAVSPDMRRSGEVVSRLPAVVVAAADGRSPSRRSLLASEASPSRRDSIGRAEPASGHLHSLSSMLRRLQRVSRPLAEKSSKYQLEALSQVSALEALLPFKEILHQRRSLFPTAADEAHARDAHADEGVGSAPASARLAAAARQ